ncbi:MAG: hypothetical protein ACFE9J_12555 [Candidatus Hermodarchaeota archaeon]
MTEAQTISRFTPRPKKREIDWAQFLDYTLFIESGEIGNDDITKFQKDLLP